MMTDNRAVPFGVRDWHELYRAAISEKDRTKLRLLIAEAEEAIILRGRELLTAVSSGSLEEEEADALDDALYALRALRSALHWRTHESRAA